MIIASEAKKDFERDGVALVSNVAHHPDLEKLCQSISCFSATPGARMFSLEAVFGSVGTLYGVINDVACEVGQRSARCVRLLLFDKSRDNNWSVPWHQDRSIAVKQRVDIDGFGTWTVKQGIPHVEPPEYILRSMFSLRLHLDNTNEKNAPLKVVPASYKLGRVMAEDVSGIALHSKPIICTARRGDIWAMKAMSIHSSERALSPMSRRVLHIDFSTTELPKPLRWAADRNVN